MRRLASELGVEAMLPYHHVPNKDALLDGLVAAIIGEVNDVTSESTGADWRAALRFPRLMFGPPPNCST